MITTQNNNVIGITFRTFFHVMNDKIINQNPTKFKELELLILILLFKGI